MLKFITIICFFNIIYVKLKATRKWEKDGASLARPFPLSQCQRARYAVLPPVGTPTRSPRPYLLAARPARSARVPY